MGFFRGKATHLIPVNPDNATSKDWVILLEAGTIVGPSPDKLRVARSTLDKKIVKKYDILLRAKQFLDVEGYDPRIHAANCSSSGLRSRSRALPSTWSSGVDRQVRGGVTQGPQLSEFRELIIPMELVIGGAR